MRWFVVALLAGIVAVQAPADEKLKGIACRSVHLQFPAPEAIAFYNEASVSESAPGTYFCVCGFNKGYFGIQELGNSKKLLIFSVWDPTSGDDPRKVDPEKRVKLLHQGEGVRIGRFGGEGTGGQSFYDFDWKPNTTYRFLVTARPDGTDRTAYSGYFFDPDKNAWKHLVTFSTITQGKLLAGYYSFVEDFKRDRKSATLARKAEFGNGWVQTPKGEWVELTKAQFTADNNPAETIDAGLVKDRFFLITGGNTENATTKLRGIMNRPAHPAPPKNLPDYQMK